MRRLCSYLIIFLFLIVSLEAKIRVGLGSEDITPPLGTPSAGYSKREGKGMIGVKDPLLANAVLIDNEVKQIVFCSVDNLGFDYGMVQEIRRIAKLHPLLENADIFISSSHTHSGGGAFIDFPFIGKKLAGPFNAEIRKYYIEKTAKAILQTCDNLQEAKIGFGVDTLPGIAYYRSSVPEQFDPLNQLFIIKLTSTDNEPLCVLFNFALHPTTLSGKNMEFSADFVGKTRELLKKELGQNVLSIFVNGAQGELVPLPLSTDEDENSLCQRVGSVLGEAVVSLWNNTMVSEDLDMATKVHPYSFSVSPPLVFNWRIPIRTHETEVALIRLNDHAILTVPGELSVVYDAKLSAYGISQGYSTVSIFGLTDDAHGYIITPEAIDKKTKESYLSLGDSEYGERVYQMLQDLLNN